MSGGGLRIDVGLVGGGDDCAGFGWQGLGHIGCRGT